MSPPQTILRSRFLRAYTTATKRRPFQVAIDGPAASGKSTTAKMVAQRLGFDYIDTGAFYRCVTLAALSEGLNPSDSANVTQISSIAEQAKIGLETIFHKPSSSTSSSSLSSTTTTTTTTPTTTATMTTTAAAATITTSFQLPTTRVFLNSRDVSSEIRTETVSKHVSAVAAIGAVREAVLDKVRNIGANDNGIGAVGSSSSTSSQQRPKDGLVMDGRDIGTVVLPNADLKIFLIADSRVRAERRLRELINNNKSKMEEPSTGTTAAATTTNLSFELNTEKVRQDLERRDELDRTRKVSPLKKAADAIELDTSGLTIEGQVDAIVEKVQSLRLHAD